MNDADLISAFHALWDEFPGIARLIDRNHTVLASNPFAETKGFTEGSLCPTVGDSSMHRCCKHSALFREGKAQSDHVLDDRIRVWLPIKGRDDVCVHFAIPVLQDCSLAHR